VAIVGGCHKDVGSYVHLKSPRLLQCCTVQHHWQLVSVTAVTAECSSRLMTQTGCHEHITAVLRGNALAACTMSDHFKLTTLMFKTLHGVTPSYLSSEWLLVSNMSRCCWSLEGTCFATKTCQCKRQSADTNMLIGRYRLSADYQCTSNIHCK